jgi:hypothetical protein
MGGPKKGAPRDWINGMRTLRVLELQTVRSRHSPFLEIARATIKPEVLDRFGAMAQSTRDGPATVAFKNVHM